MQNFCLLKSESLFQIQWSDGLRCAFRVALPVPLHPLLETCECCFLKGSQFHINVLINICVIY